MAVERMAIVGISPGTSIRDAYSFDTSPIFPPAGRPRTLKSAHFLVDGD